MLCFSYLTHRRGGLLMAEDSKKAPGDQKPTFTYIFLTSDGNQIRLNMDSRGYYVHAIIRELAALMKVSADTIKLSCKDPSGASHPLEPGRMLDEQLVKIAELNSRDEVSTVLIDIQLEKSVDAQGKASQTANVTEFRSERFRRQAVRVLDPKATDPVSVVRFARSHGASKRGGFLWLSRRYLVKIGDIRESYYSQGSLSRAMGFAF